MWTIGLCHSAALAAHHRAYQLQWEHAHKLPVPPPICCPCTQQHHHLCWPCTCSTHPWWHHSPISWNQPCTPHHWWWNRGHSWAPATTLPFKVQGSMGLSYADELGIGTKACPSTPSSTMTSRTNADTCHIHPCYVWGPPTEGWLQLHMHPDWWQPHLLPWRLRHQNGFSGTYQDHAQQHPIPTWSPLCLLWHQQLASNCWTSHRNSLTSTTSPTMPTREVFTLRLQKGSMASNKPANLPTTSSLICLDTKCRKMPELWQHKWRPIIYSSSWMTLVLNTVTIAKQTTCWPPSKKPTSYHQLDRN